MLLIVISIYCFPSISETMWSTTNERHKINHRYKIIRHVCAWVVRVIIKYVASSNGTTGQRIAQRPAWLPFTPCWRNELAIQKTPYTVESIITISLYRQIHYIRCMINSFLLSIENFEILALTQCKTFPNSVSGTQYLGYIFWILLST